MVLPSSHASGPLASLFLAFGVFGLLGSFLLGFGILLVFSVWNMRSKRGNLSEPPQASSSTRIEFDVRQVNASLFELHKPLGDPKLQILFFHGLNLEGFKYPRLCTWESADGSCLWPQEWLPKLFPGAHILSVCYDGIVKSSNEMFIIGENLVSDIISQNIGQLSNCPIIMVGHCLGGLVIKELCSQAHRQSNLIKDQKAKLNKFLSNVRGVFFYSTPHHGTQIFKTLTAETDNPLLTYFQTLNKDTERLNQDFDRLREWYTKWRARVLGACLPMKSGPLQDVVVVPESSARYGDQFNHISATHSSICKPDSKKSTSFIALTNLVKDVLENLEMEMEVPDKAIHKCFGLPKYNVSVKKRADHAREQLANTSILGIVGMGGIGKTTIAKQLFNNISKDFEYTCFVDNIKGLQKHDLRNYLLRHLHHNGNKVDPSKIKWDDLRKKRTLIILDDVDSRSLLKDLQLPELDHFDNGSKFIITSRNQHIFSVYQKGAFGLYDVNFLEVDESRKLFCFHVCGSEDIPSSYTKRNRHLKRDIDRVVEKCQGLPLTLQVMGGYLQNHINEPRIWEQTLERFGKAKDIGDDDNEEVWKSLRVSYDALSKEAQHMFIDAATYFFEKPVHVALAAWSTTHESSDLMWLNLLRRSMVKSQWSDSADTAVVWVHEHLRDLAKHVIEGNESKEASGPIDFENVHGVKTIEQRLQLSYLSSTDGRSHVDMDLNHRLVNDTMVLVLNVRLLEKLQNLKYLQLGEVGKWGIVECEVECEGSCKNLSRKISLVKLIGSRPKSSLPISLEAANKLAVLELEGWEVSNAFPDTLATLINLRILSLDSLRGLDRLPATFGNLRKLQRLKLSCLYQFFTLPDSFGELSSLEHLELRDVTIEMLPRSFANLSSLETLIFSGCGHLQRLPDNFGQLMALKMLTIYADDLEGLPDSFGNLATLTVLHLRHCPRLKRLPTNFGLLSALEELKFEGCYGLRELSDNFGQLMALKKLNIEDHQLSDLPDSFGNLTALADLTLKTCHRLERLPKSFGQLTGLKELSIRGAPRLVALPDSFGLLSSLECLHIQCEKLDTLPDSVGNLNSLRILGIYCLDLKMLPESLGSLSSLQFLSIVSNSLEKFPTSTGCLHSLRHLALRLKSVRSLPEKLGDLSSLETLRVVSCHSLEVLPESLGRARSLRKVILRNCSRLMTVPGSPAKSRWPQSSPREGQFKSQIPSMMIINVSSCPMLTDARLELLDDWHFTGNPDDDTKEYRRLGNLGGEEYTEEYTEKFTNAFTIFEDLFKMKYLNWSTRTIRVVEDPNNPAFIL